MAQKKPTPPVHPDDLPPLFADTFSDESGGSAPARIEVYRVSPNGGALIGEPPLDATMADLQDFVRTEDKTYGRRGGVYDARLKDATGKWVKRHRFRVDRDPELGDAGAATSTVPATDPTFAAVSTMVTMMEAQARSYEQRVRADMAAREQAAKLDLERREREWLAQQARERAYYDQQRERDRELSDQARERDRGMFSFLLEAGRRSNGGDGVQTLQTFLAGLELAQQMGDGGKPGKGGIADAIMEKFGGRVVDKIIGPDAGDGDATPTTATPTTDDVTRARRAKQATPPAKGKRKAPPPPDDDEDDDDEGKAIIDMVETLLLNVDADAAAVVLVSLVKNGKLKREVLGELAKGNLDAVLEYEPDVLDKLHKAAETAYRESSPRPVKATK
jgi:hypothetical protein